MNFIDKDDNIFLMKILFKILDGGRVPAKQTAGSAGYDLFAANEVVIGVNEVKLVKLGFCMAIENGYEAQIRSRSGMALRSKVFVLNAPGTIDSDYRNEVCVLLINLGETEFVVHKDDRIAQMVFSAYINPTIHEVESLDETERFGGFGSTGV